MSRSRSLRIVIFMLMLTAVAFTQDGEKRVTPIDPAVRQSFERQPKIAVLAGVGQYPSRSGLSTLRFPSRDVDLLEAELTRQGYKVVSLKEQEATRGSITRAFKDAAELVDQGSGTVLFFFSGHGFTDKGANYLATFEATADDLAGSGLSLPAVEELLRATGAPRATMFIDACRNEPGKSAGARSFERLQASAGLRTLFSTKVGRISYEDDDLKNGVFAHFLIEGMRGAAAGTDGLITFRDLADYVTGAVSSYGFKKGRMQVPYEAGESSGDFLLARAVAPPKPAEPASTVVEPTRMADLAGTKWKGQETYSYRGRSFSKILQIDLKNSGSCEVLPPLSRPVTPTPRLPANYFQPPASQPQHWECRWAGTAAGFTIEETKALDGFNLAKVGATRVAAHIEGLTLYGDVVHTPRLSDQATDIRWIFEKVQ